MKRKLSLFLAAVALIGVPVWAYLQGEAETNAQVAARGWACGMPILGLYLFAMFVSGCLSIVALALAVLAYRKLPRPRPRGRFLELVFVALPFFAAAAAIEVLWVYGD